MTKTELSEKAESLEITDISELKNISVKCLTTKYGYRAVDGINITSVFSSPKRIHYGKGEFIGHFIFVQNLLETVFLDPLIPGVTSPNYPSEEYQNTKKEYCISILREMYGRESKSDTAVTYWENGNIRIGCSVILEGKGKYTGGDIFIDLKKLYD